MEIDDNIKTSSGYTSEKDIIFIQKKLDVIFPISFKTLIQKYNGAFLKKNIFFYTSQACNSDENSSVGMFLFTSLESVNFFDHILNRNKKEPEFFPEGIISFASVGNGDLICFDYRADPKTDNPPIVIWEHEAAGSDEAVSFIAPDFESFMNMLMSDEEAEKEYTAPQG